MSKQEYNIDEFVNFCMELTEFKSENSREFIIHTGKEGAINCHMATYDGDNRDEYESRLRRELPDGMYEINSDISKDFIRKL